MSLLYKALHQASQSREKGSSRDDPAIAPRPGTAAAAPLAERLLAQGIESAAVKSGPVRMARMILLGLLGLAAIAGSAALFLPAAPPQQIAVPEPAAPAEPQPAPVAEAPPAAEPVPAEPLAQNEAAPEPEASAAADELAMPIDGEAAIDAPPPDAPSAPPERIGGSEAGPAEVMPQQQRIRQGGLERFVEEQVAREALAGLRPPVDIDRSSMGGAIGQRAPVEITDDTAIVRERYESAALMLERGEPAEALQIYDLLLRNNPKDRLALLGRAAALQKLGRTLMAVSAYEDVLASFPRDEWALVNLLSLVSAQEPQRALAQLERLQKLNTSTALLPAQIGMIRMAQGDYELAARSLEKAVALDPENAKYIFNLAVLYDKWGQTQMALRYYRQCLEMAQQNPDGQVPLEAVRQRLAFLDVK